MQILNHRQINQKIKRLAIEILEHNFEEPQIILAGINNNGMSFARMLFAELEQITDIPLVLTQIRLNPAAPLSQPIVLDLSTDEVVDKSIIVVDDVANTGRTIFYACKPILEVVPKKVEVAVLVDRMHKSFPVKVDYMGLSLATTMKENIRVTIRDTEEYSVSLS